MKFFQKTWVAWTITVLLIGFSVLSGWERPEVTPTTNIQTISKYEKYIVDEAGLLSAETEKQLAAYNAGFDESYGSITALVTSSSEHDLESACYYWADKLGLSGYDIILLYDSTSCDWYCVYGNDIGEFADIALETAVSNPLRKTNNKSFESDILVVYGELTEWYHHSGLKPSKSDKTSLFSLPINILLVILFLIIGAVKLIINLTRKLFDKVFRRTRPFSSRPGPIFRNINRPPPVIHHTSVLRSSSIKRNSSRSGFAGSNRSGSSHSSRGSFTGGHNGGFGNNSRSTKGSFSGGRSGGFGSSRGGGFGKR